MQNLEAEKELYAQREAMMIPLRHAFQQKQLEKSFDRWAQAARLFPPDLVSSSEDEGAPDVRDSSDDE